MTLYARSDVMSVALSKDHGGCGATHMRPVTHGAPAKVWALDCTLCEDHLRSDPHWAIDALEIPETPDETRLREKAEEKGEHSQKVNLENAVASLATTAEGFQKLMMMMFASNPDMAKNMNKMLGVLAVGENSMAVQQAAEAHTASIVPNPLGYAPEDLATPPSGPNDTLDGLKLSELRALAKSRGLDSTGDRAQLLKRLYGQA